MHIDRSILTEADELLASRGAVREGHFLLSSGLHSNRYCQCARLFEHPNDAAKAAKLMVTLLKGRIEADIVLAPALGGILWGYELARALGVRTIFAERNALGAFELRRGFTLAPAERVLLAEDVITTGKSVMELAPLVQESGAHIAGFAAIADRSGGAFQPGPPVCALTRLDFEVYDPAECPLCREGGAPEKPGSRREPATSE